MSGPERPAVSLRLATRSDLAALSAIRLGPGQDNFVSTFDDWPDAARDMSHLHIIDANRAAAGFFRIDPEFQRRDPRLPNGTHGLRGLLIDAARQGQGIGHAAFTALPDHLRSTYPELDAVWLTVDTPNTAAIRLYEATGWQRSPLGTFIGPGGPEWIYRLPL